MSLINSRILERKKQFEDELKKGVKDPVRKASILKYILQLERDIGVLGFNETEIEKGGLSIKQKT